MRRCIAGYKVTIIITETKKQKKNTLVGPHSDLSSVTSCILLCTCLPIYISHRIIFFFYVYPTRAHYYSVGITLNYTKLY